MRRIQLTSNFLPGTKKAAKSLSFGLIIEVPKENIIKKTDIPIIQCNSCGSYYKTGEQCPICNVCVEKPIQSCYLEEFYYQPANLVKKDRLIAFIFDLNIPNVLLQRVFNSLMEESFIKTLGNDNFILIFNGMHPIFITKKEGYIHLQVGVYDSDITPHLFPASQIPELFEQVIVLISTCGFRIHLEKSTASIFESLKTFKPDRVIYFYASTVPSLPNLPFAVHCINVSSPSSRNITPYSIFYENHFSFLMIQQTSKNVNGYLSLILDRNVPLRSTTTITVSNGLNLEWISTPYEEICKRTRTITLSSSYFHSLNSIMCALSVSSAFRNNNSFCLQISTVLDDKTIYVANNYFRKASNDDEFNLSFNFYAFGMLYLRQTAVSYFSSKGIFDRRYQWNYNNIPCDVESQGFVKKLIKRFNSVISSNSPLNNAQKDYLLFSINNLGIPFISDVINNLIAPPNEDYILLPPFIFYRSDSENEKQQQLDLLQGGTIIISEYLSPANFDRLFNIISLQ